MPRMWKIVNRQTNEVVKYVNSERELVGFHKFPYRIFQTDEKEERNETMDAMNIKIKRLTDTAKIPTRGSAYAAGYDIYADLKETITIEPHTTAKIPTGFATDIPNGFFGAVFPRSGMATKKDLNLANCVAVIDPDYRGEWFIPLHNIGQTAQTVEPGDRIAQMIILPYQVLEFEEVQGLNSTIRGDGGFGSSGTK